MSDGNPIHAQLLGHIGLTGMKIREAAMQAKASDPATVLQLLDQIAADVLTIGSKVADLADALGCGSETVAVMSGGIERINAARACHGLEGRA